MSHKQTAHTQSTCDADHNNDPTIPQPPEVPSLHPLLPFPKILGNHAVGRIMQAKQKVNESGDRYEQRLIPWPIE